MRSAVSVPSTVEGTTRESTLEPNDPGSSCSGVEGTVWYSLDPGATRRVSIEMTARGDLEGVIEVFERDRSDLDARSTATRRTGAGTLPSRSSPSSEKRYLIRVGEEFDSESGDFRLELFRPEPEATASGAAAAAPRRRRDGRSRARPDRRVVEAPAGRRVVRRHRRRALERVPGGQRVRAAVSRASTPRSRSTARSCDAHNLFTPDRNGRYSFLVRAVARGSRHAALPAARPARAARRHGARQHPAQLRARARARRARSRGRRGPAPLLREAPKRRDAALLDRRAARARAAQHPRAGVREELRDDAPHAAAPRPLLRDRAGPTTAAAPTRCGPSSRDITRAGIAINGRRQAVIAPGQAATAGRGRLRPAARGRITIVVERLDPLEGWQFHQAVRAADGDRTCAGHVGPAASGPLPGARRVLGQPALGAERDAASRTSAPASAF